MSIVNYSRMSVSAGELPRRHQRRLSLAATTRAMTKSYVTVTLSTDGKERVAQECRNKSYNTQRAIDLISGLPRPARASGSLTQGNGITAFSLGGYYFQGGTDIKKGGFGKAVSFMSTPGNPSDPFDDDHPDEVIGVAVKFFSGPYGGSEGAAEEDQIRAATNGPTCAPVVARMVEFGSSVVGVIMPLAAFDLRRMENKFNLEDASKIAEAIYDRASCILREKGYAHMDIKLDNVLAFCELGGGDITISLGDIGSFEQVASDNYFTHTYRPPFPDLHFVYNMKQLGLGRVRDWLLWTSLICAFELSNKNVYGSFSTAYTDPIPPSPNHEYDYENWLFVAALPIVVYVGTLFGTSTLRSSSYFKDASALVKRLRSDLRSQLPEEVRHTWDTVYDMKFGR